MVTITLGRKTECGEKNRNDQKRCMGVDLNRNYASNWGGPGSSSDTCSDSYRGAGPFSEPESTAHSNLIMDLQKITDYSIQAYLTFHSYSQLVIFPYGKDFTSIPSNYDELLALGQSTVKAIFDVNGVTYTTGQTTETLYPAAGGSDDWAIDDAPVRLSYTFELRDTGKYGFNLPEDQIEPQAKEIIEGVKVIGEYVLSL